MMTKPRLRMVNGQWAVFMTPQPSKFDGNTKRAKLHKKAHQWAYNRNIAINANKFEPRPGAVRHMRSDGTYSCANPRDLLFSIVTMSAREYWTGTEWTRIFNEDDE